MGVITSTIGDGIIGTTYGDSITGIITGTSGDTTMVGETTIGGGIALIIGVGAGIFILYLGIMLLFRKLGKGFNLDLELTNQDLEIGEHKQE